MRYDVRLSFETGYITFAIEAASDTFYTSKTFDMKTLSSFAKIKQFSYAHKQKKQKNVRHCWKSIEQNIRYGKCAQILQYWTCSSPL